MLWRIWVWCQALSEEASPIYPPMNHQRITISCHWKMSDGASWSIFSLVGGDRNHGILWLSRNSWEWNNHRNCYSLHHVSEGLAQPPTSSDWNGNLVLHIWWFQVTRGPRRRKAVSPAREPGPYACRHLLTRCVGFFGQPREKSRKYLGLSENSVPLNPMVNDHHPY